MGNMSHELCPDSCFLKVRRQVDLVSGAETLTHLVIKLQEFREVLG